MSKLSRAREIAKGHQERSPSGRLGKKENMHQLFLHPWVLGYSAALIFLVAGWKMNGNSANIMLVLAVAIFAAVTYKNGLISDQPVIPRALWTGLISCIVSLVLYYWLWTKPERPLEALRPRLQYSVLCQPVDFFTSEPIAGIEWKEGYAKVSLFLINESDDSYTDIDAIFSTDISIIKAGARSDVNVGMRTVINSPPVMMFAEFRLKDGRTVASEPVPVQTTNIGPEWRMRCDKFLSHSRIEVVIAAVQQYAPSLGGPIYNPHRVDPQFLHLKVTYWVNGKKETDETQIDLTKNR